MMLVKGLGELSCKFHADNVGVLLGQQDRFAPGKPLDAALLFDEGLPEHRLLRAFLAKIPNTIHEAINAAARSALSTTPPTPITFAWAPGYDYELTIWHAKCGITVLLKSRFADDESTS